MPAGRPTKYEKQFCAVVIGVGELGGWLSEMAEACDVHRNTMDEWARAHPEFLEALMRAQQKAQAWFEREGREGLKAERFNAPLWQKQMSSRHRSEYTERSEITGANGGPIKTEDTTLDATKLSTSALAEIAAARRNAEPDES